MKNNMIGNAELDVILAAAGVETCEGIKQVLRRALRLVEGAPELEKERVNKDSPNKNSTALGKAEANKTEFTVILAAVGDRKLEVISGIHALTGIGLITAKDLVEAAPKAVKESVNWDEACRF
jgi:ribosomal protein L7/L12